MRTCPSSEAKALRPPYNPLPTSRLLIFDPPTLPQSTSPSPVTYHAPYPFSLLTTTFRPLCVAFHPPPLVFKLSSCQITSNKTGQWSLSARSQLWLCVLNGRVCLNVQWTHECLGVDACACVCARVCVPALVNGRMQQHNTHRSAGCELNEWICGVCITAGCCWSVCDICAWILVRSHKNRNALYFFSPHTCTHILYTHRHRKAVHLHDGSSQQSLWCDCRIVKSRAEIV